MSIRSADVLGPVDDRVRLAPLLRDPRTFLHQNIRTKNGRSLGTCRDVQFSTKSWRVEWIFPKKFFRWGVALPLSEVIEVTTAAIIVKGTEATASDVLKDEPSILEEVSEVAEKGVPRPSTMANDKRATGTNVQ